MGGTRTVMDENRFGGLTAGVYTIFHVLPYRKMGMVSNPIQYAHH